ncbi:KpsF/GutQ family sugar-phosphate isomerase [Marinimicrobium sp. ARAG 43.8]|uniref:KpsF/GutQ family sugar-phosphate isomerase n=1 Tax=Marinimicrobium sp. ARAG 43.8 TaxID=3418719 RepID=UPI003CE690A6
MTDFDFIQSGQRTVDIEQQAVSSLRARIDQRFERACELLLQVRGRVIVTGMGKSGHIGKKIAATLASTGTPAFFVHPGEASHGDLGMITREDAVIAISYSGNSDEIITLLPLLKRLGVPIISMTGAPHSALAQEAAVDLDISVATEACPLALAPTASTTATLVVGDALAIALLEARGFTAEDFAFSHPGGTLGRKLLLRVQDIMHRGDAIPRVTPGTSLSDALLEMTRKGFGMTTVVNEQDQLQGIYTDGDLRRSIDRGSELTGAIIGDLMSPRPKTIDAQTLAAEALKIMEDNKITALIVSDEQSRPLGVVHMHDILRAGIF